MNPHRYYQLLLQADEPLSPEQQALLSEHLAACAECQAYAKGKKGLQTLLADLHPEDSLAADELKQMHAGITVTLRSKPMHTRLTPILRTLAWGGLALLLVALVAWSIRTLAPIPAAEPTLTSDPLFSTPTPTPAGDLPSLFPSETAQSASTPPPSLLPSGQIALLPQVQFVFTATLPSAPQQVALYVQGLSPEVDAQTAAQMAAQLGIQGKATQTPGEATQTPGEASWPAIFDVSDSQHAVRFITFPNQFVYNLLGEVATGTPLPFEQRAAIAEQFLRDHQLLTAPYRVETLKRDANGVRFVQLLDGHPVMYGIGESGAMAWIDVTVDPAGQVSLISYSAHDFQPVGEYSILSAQQAWERLSAPHAAERSSYAIFPPDQVENYWERAYPLGQEVQILGNVSATSTGLSFSALGASTDWPLSGALEGLAGREDQLVLLSGQFQEENGKRIFQVSGAEARTADDVTYAAGWLHRQEEQGLLATEDGQTYVLPALPADLPDGVWVNVMGIVGAQNNLEWTSLDTVVSWYSSSQSCYVGGGSGGGGPSNANIVGGIFAQLKLGEQTAPTPTPTPLPAEDQPGQHLEGLSGYVYVTIYQNGGNSHTSASLTVDGLNGAPGINYLLEGAQALSGIEQYHSLPIRIWGTVDRYLEGMPVVTLERFEAAYPGLQVQAWLGTYQAVTLEGVSTALFTGQDGTQYVLLYAEDQPVYSDFVAAPGQSIIVEGIAIPNKTYGGYPVIKLIGAGMGSDLAAYTITGNRPLVVDETPFTEEPASVNGVVTIESVELAYLAISLNNCLPEHASDPLNAGLYVQPMWVFRGHFEDGRQFEMRVQALPDGDLR